MFKRSLNEVGDVVWSNGETSITFNSAGDRYDVILYETEGEDPSVCRATVALGAELHKALEALRNL